MQHIHINRNPDKIIEFESPEITVPIRPGEDCSFEMVISNYGSPTHVHISAGDKIRKYVQFLYENPYVANQEYVPVVANLPEGTEWVEGDVKVATGYGANKEVFRISIGIKPVDAITKTKRIVDVDERLGTPFYLQDRANAVSAIKDDENDRYSANAEMTDVQTHKLETFIVPLLMVLIAMVVLLATFTFNMIDKLTGAVAASIILMVILAYAAIHLLIKKE